MYRNKKISLVIPCFNEEKGIGYVLSRVPSFIDEVLVVDNNSQDKTAAVAKKLGATVILEKKQGYGAAYKAGLKKVRGEIIITLDGDGSYTLSKIEKIVDQVIDKDFDFISCARRLAQEKSLDSLLRRLGNLLLNGTILLLFGKKFSDSQSGMWIFKKRILQYLNPESDGMAFSEEIKIEAFTRPNLKTEEVEVPYHPRIGKSKLKVWQDGLKNLFFLFEKRFAIKSVDLLFLLIIFGICFVLMWPSFFLPWSLIDDGVSVLNSQKILEGAFSLNFNEIFSVVWESSVGRFRPVYWVYNFLAYLIGGKNPLFYHFLRFLNFGFVGSLVFIIGKKIGSDRTAGFFSFLFLAFSFLTFENWYRLGPQEPLTTLFLAITFYLLVEKKISLVFWPVLILFFLKETNISLVFAFLFLLLINQKNKILDQRQLIQLFIKISLAGLVAIVLIGLARTGGSYSSNYQLGIKGLMSNFIACVSYIRTYFGYLPLIGFLVFCFLKKRREEFFWQSTLLALFFLLFLVILPWSFPLGRYLLPPVFFLSILLGVTLAELLNWLRGYILLKFIIILYLIGIILQNGIIMAGTFYDFIQREENNALLVSYLASSVPPGGKILLNLVDDESTVEYFEEIKTHLSLFYGRDDLKILYLKSEKSIEPGDFVVEGYLKQKISPLPARFSKIKSIEKKFKTLIVTTPMGFVKRMGRWVIGSIHSDKKIPEGIYTFFYGNYYWYIYQAGPYPGMQ
jgi:glycosyltransferase involved in cell wall biosynthesis